MAYKSYNRSLFLRLLVVVLLPAVIGWLYATGGNWVFLLMLVSLAQTGTEKLHAEAVLIATTMLSTLLIAIPKKQLHNRLKKASNSTK